MASLLWWILFFIDEFFIFRLESVVCKKYTNTDGKDRKYTNAIDISIIWLYWRLLCRLYCRMYCRPYWRLFFVTQYFFFLLFHKCSKFMTLSDASRMFLSCYCFFLFFYHFYFTQNPRGYSFQHVVLSMFILKAQGKKVERKFFEIQFLHIHFLIQSGRRWNVPWSNSKNHRKPLITRCMLPSSVGATMCFLWQNRFDLLTRVYL